ncbi:MAG: CotH kinase family protein [Clostridia bacterium]|nr:CotH kinase family protein [Clostridia bacterium]
MIAFSLCFTLLFCANAFAANSPLFSISLGQEENQATIIPYLKEKNSFLFFPGSWVDQSVVIHTSEADGIFIDDVFYQDGDLAPTFTNNQTLKVRKATQKNPDDYVVYIGSKIPSLFISLDPDDLIQIHESKNETVPAHLVAFRSDGTIELSQNIGDMKTRGNTTRKYPKKPYQIKFEEKTDFFGLGKSKKFILLADYLDISLLRNRITYDMAVTSGLPYALSSLHADLFINGEYRGLYLLTEKIEIGDSSVDIHNLEKETEKLNENPLEDYPRYDGDSEGLRNARWYDIPNNPEDVSGGYILETDKVFRYNKESDAGFITTRNMAVYIKEPEYPSQKQVEYISGLVNSFHRAITEKDGIDPQTGKHFSQIGDMTSFSKKYLLEEVSKNFDALLGSQYFFKEKGDDFLYAGPAWDYDLSYGNIRQEGFMKHSGGRHFYLSTYTTKEYWYNNLIKHEDFEQLVIDTYGDVFHPMLEVLLGIREEAGYEPLKSIASYREEIEASAEMNFTRWLPGGIKDYYKGAGFDFNSGVKYLTRFLELRLEFLDREWMK